MINTIFDGLLLIFIILYSLVAATIAYFMSKGITKGLYNKCKPPWMNPKINGDDNNETK